MIKDWVAENHHLLSITDRRFQCPACSQDRSSAHKAERCMTARIGVGRTGDLVYVNCWHCGASGAYPIKGDSQMAFEGRPVPVVHKPLFEEDWAPSLDAETKQYLLDRGISKQTALKARLFSEEYDEGPYLCFPYFKDEILYSSKKRAVREKKFYSSPGGRDTLYLSELVDESIGTMVICVGEMDALSFLEAGVRNPVSLPNGDQAFGDSLFTNSPFIKRMQRIIIAGDNDESFRKVRAELARRLGKARCWILNWPEGIKDANEYLLAHGPQALASYLEQAAPMPVEGLYEASAFTARVLELYKGDVSKGFDTGIPDLDELYSVPDGYLTVVTGLPGGGKTALLMQLLEYQAARHNRKTSMWSPEAAEEIHIANILELHTRKPFWHGYEDRLTEGEIENNLPWIKKNFFFLRDGDQPATIESILERHEAAIQRYGVRNCVIDPFNNIARSETSGGAASGAPEHEWIKNMLAKSRKFARSHEVHVFFVAHPRLLYSNSTIPNGQSISGGAAWNAMTDFGLTVHRQETNVTLCELWKVKHRHHGKLGSIQLEFNRRNGRFSSFGGGFGARPDPREWEGDDLL